MNLCMSPFLYGNDKPRCFNTVEYLVPLLPRDLYEETTRCRPPRQDQHRKVSQKYPREDDRTVLNVHVVDDPEPTQKKGVWLTPGD